MSSRVFQHDYIFKCLTLYDYNQLSNYSYEYSDNLTLGRILEESLCSIIKYVLRMYRLPDDYTTKVKLLIAYDHVFRCLLSCTFYSEVYTTIYNVDHRFSSFGWTAKELNWRL